MKTALYSEGIFSESQRSPLRLTLFSSPSLTPGGVRAWCGGGALRRRQSIPCLGCHNITFGAAIGHNHDEGRAGEPGLGSWCPSLSGRRKQVRWQSVSDCRWPGPAAQSSCRSGLPVTAKSLQLSSAWRQEHRLSFSQAALLLCEPESEVGQWPGPDRRAAAAP
jgi:hypothetical protein